ncbi:MAG: SWIM zinc finger domain-containing protein [Methanotrichaceae archaeon]
MNFGADEIRKLCTEASFERGKKYHDEGRVNILEASPTGVTAEVQGTEKYNVKVDLMNGISAECNCPYDLEGYCKHIVAVLLSMLDNKEEIEAMMAKSRRDQAAALALLKEADPMELRDFLRNEIELLPPLRAHFMTWFSQSGDLLSIHDYKREINKLFSETGIYDDEVYYGPEVDFSSIEQIAEINKSKKSFLEAAKIYQALFESIDERMESIDESSGYYESKFSNYLSNYVNCIKTANLDPKARRKPLKYLFERYVSDSQFFESEYLQAMEELCVSREDREYVLELMEPYLQEEEKIDEENAYRKLALISTKLRLLWALERKNDYYDLIEQYYQHSPNLCLSYARALKEDSKLELSVKVAEECTSLFLDYQIRSIKEFLSELYEHYDTEKYKENLLWLFLNTNEWKYYEALKAGFPESWSDILSSIINSLSQDRYHIARLIDVYLREGMYEEAFKRVLESRSLLLLANYHKDLAERYPNEYFQAYRELIHSFAGKETGRRHYQEVISYLKKMREIKEFDGEFAEFVKMLRQENHRKPAFIDEMKVF